MDPRALVRMPNRYVLSTEVCVHGVGFRLKLGEIGDGTPPSDDL